MSRRSLFSHGCMATGAALALLVAACGAEPQREPTAEEIEGARNAASLLGQRLKSRLVSAMQEGGPAAAVEVCAEEAPVIAAEISAETGYDVGRTSLSTRNKDNDPDAWEREQFLRFVAFVKAGGDPRSTEAAAILEGADGAVLRYARPIMMEPQCAVCHGTEVDPDLLARIRDRYPDDAATGFEIGDVRGIFTVKRPVEAR